MTGPRSRPRIARAPHLSARAERVLANADAAWASAFGAGSRIELRERYASALVAAPRSLPAPTGRAERAEHLQARVEREHRATHGVENLVAELEDERARDAARTDDTALVFYEKKWAKRLAKLQRLYPSRWRVRGLSDDEVRDELTLRLIDAVRTKPEELAKHQRAGKEWGLLFMAHQSRALRHAFKLRVVLADPSPALDLRRSEPTHEERLMEHQSACAMALARERAENSLSRPQRRWFAAMRMTANAGAFFESSGKLNLSEVSRLLDKDRSSAQRAFSELSERFVHELSKLGD